MVLFSAVFFVSTSEFTVNIAWALSAKEVGMQELKP